VQYGALLRDREHCHTLLTGKFVEDIPLTKPFVLVLVVKVFSKVMPFIHGIYANIILRDNVLQTKTWLHLVTLKISIKSQGAQSE
jgi:hypothetical protein